MQVSTRVAVRVPRRTGEPAPSQCRDGGVPPRMFIELTAPLEALGFARPSLPEGTAIEFERTASVSGHRSASVIVSGADVGGAVAALRENPLVDDVAPVSEREDESVYDLTWGVTLPGLLTCIGESDGTIISAAAVDDTWAFELRFSEGNASRFYERYRDAEHPITVQRVTPDSATRPARRAGLTAKQREMLLHALDTGYFDVPRRTTMVDLAGEFDISDTAVSQRLRRGLSTVLRRSVSTAPDGVASLGSD